MGWTIPPDGAATYASWASKHTLVVGDILGSQLILFKFVRLAFYHCRKIHIRITCFNGYKYKNMLDTRLPYRFVWICSV